MEDEAVFRSCAVASGSHTSAFPFGNGPMDAPWMMAMQSQRAGDLSSSAASSFPMPPSLSPFSGDFDFDSEYESLKAQDDTRIDATSAARGWMSSESHALSVPMQPAAPFALCCTHVVV